MIVPDLCSSLLISAAGQRLQDTLTSASISNYVSNQRFGVYVGTRGNVGNVGTRFWQWRRMCGLQKQLTSTEELVFAMQLITLWSLDVLPFQFFPLLSFLCYLSIILCYIINAIPPLLHPCITSFPPLILFVFPFPLSCLVSVFVCAVNALAMSPRNPSCCLTYSLVLILHNTNTTNNNNTHALDISHIVSDSALVSSVTMFATASQRPLCSHHIFASCLHHPSVPLFFPCLSVLSGLFSSTHCRW